MRGGGHRHISCLGGALVDGGPCTGNVRTVMSPWVPQSSSPGAPCHGSVPCAHSCVTGQGARSEVSSRLNVCPAGSKEGHFLGEVGASPEADQSRTVPWEQRQLRTQTVGHLSHHRNHTSAFSFVVLIVTLTWLVRDRLFCPLNRFPWITSVC